MLLILPEYCWILRLSKVLQSDFFHFTGEKPFRCLLPSCLKRFRYKGDLSKHIKRYHPGHSQALTPVPLQEDELRSAMTAKHVYQSSTSSGISSNSSTSSRSSTSSVSAAVANNGNGKSGQMVHVIKLVSRGGHTNLRKKSTFFRSNPEGS